MEIRFFEERGKMKKLLALCLLFVSSVVLADYSCTATIKDGYSSRETFTRFSYSESAACSNAQYDCERFLGDMRSRGVYQNAYCMLDRNQGPDFPPAPYPDPSYPPRENSCQTDLVDYYGRIVRTFTGSGRDYWSACNEADRFCQEALYRGTTQGRSCVRAGSRPGPNPRPPQDPWITETCRAQRLDPQGYLIQEYTATHSGPRSSNPRLRACQEAERSCSYDLRGRQTCRAF
jgi:hypothetical protein